MSDTIKVINETERDIVPLGIKLSWSLGALGVAFMMNSVAFFALYYMISVLKIEPAVAGIVVFLL